MNELFELDESGMFFVYKKDVLNNGFKPRQFIDYIHCNFNFPGIYFLFYKNELQYIGSSLVNIGFRMRDHVRAKFFEIDAVIWINEISIEKIRPLENELIKKFQPKYNVIGKNGIRYKGKYRGKKVHRHEQTLDY